MKLTACPICGEPRECFAVEKWHDGNPVESCEWCGTSYPRDVLDEGTPRSPKAEKEEAK